MVYQNPLTHILSVFLAVALVVAASRWYTALYRYFPKTDRKPEGVACNVLLRVPLEGGNLLSTISDLEICAKCCCCYRAI